ncbi:MAG: polyhydroxyalkanoate synthesis repressor PhaR [Rhodocyclaceae bacterium]|nr:polyhydroxyalkanoate synthesis repressor PhaR [Rhodocyclaceae bacterium]MBK9623407.1 polyhydroxyalkanoate synthesis repressor PhaR [Rhodocyclaceae bacterium]MBL0076097.1 polyhydroxyalkanoate synthesis repressor PhaR [Rhodocyclaceae bacterium]MBP6108321.1 polyhydroxyalkanoate synthesis repressor PhaR [Rhodocyclaceae bacterium]MBP6278337.1 polyhydroxyalkanoate synthesis repressor PhaR [Rhodocyclaceae bacterium]
MTTKQRLIKKYPNRRLYDTKTSAYITLVDVKELVLAHEEFVVQDAKTGEDLTRSILLQIILEEETGGAPMFSADILTQMIRFYGSAMQGMMGQYIEGNIKTFSEMQRRLKEQAKGAFGDKSGVNSQEMWAQFLKAQGPAMQGMVGAYVEQSQRVAQKMQEVMAEQTHKFFPGLYPAESNKPSGNDKK